MRKRLAFFLVFVMMVMLILYKTIDAGQNASSGYKGDQLLKNPTDFLTTLKGFNLTNRSNSNSDWGNRSYEEWQVKAVSEFGFNFVRLPIDIKNFYLNDNTNKLNFDFFNNELDKVLELTKKYKVHAQICIVVNPSDKGDIWNNESFKKSYINLWEIIARRYINIPNSKLSFNLYNEPHDVSDDIYSSVMSDTIDKIRKIDYSRYIFVDGNNFSRTPQKDLVKDNVIQSVHCYEPFSITHYKADWIDGSNEWSIPQYPKMLIPKFNITKDKVIKLNGNFSDGDMIIHVNSVSGSSVINVSSNEEVIGKIVCYAGNNENNYNSKLARDEIKVDKDYRIKIKNPTNNINLYLDKGEGATIDSVTIQSTKIKTVVKSNSDNYNDTNLSVSIKNGKVVIQDKDFIIDRQWLQSKNLSSWLVFRNNYNTAIFAGEWGVHNLTPHDVTLAYMKDMLNVFNNNKMGWALWNLDGTFGIIDSGRKDVKYEDYNGHKLDREMLELLKKYK